MGNRVIRYSLSAEEGNLIDKVKNIIDKYSQKQYNDFGWARVNVLSSQENADFRSKFSEVVTNKNSKPDTINGEYIIACGALSGKDEGVNNKLVYANGSKNNLQKLTISKVVEIKLDNETDVEIIRDFIVEGEQNGNTSASFVAQSLYGAESVVINTRKDFPSYQELKRNARERASRSESEGNTSANRIGDQRNRTPKQTQSNEIAPINEVSSKDGAFFDGKKPKSSLTAEGDTPKKYGNRYTPATELRYEGESIAPMRGNEMGEVETAKATENTAPQSRRSGFPV